MRPPSTCDKKSIRLRTYHLLEEPDPLRKPSSSESPNCCCNTQNRRVREIKSQLPNRGHSAAAGSKASSLARYCMKYLRVRVTDTPLLWLTTIFVLLPKFTDEFKNRFWRLDLFKARSCVVLHTLRLPKSHFNTISFRLNATCPLLTKVLDARIDKLFVKSLLISQRLNRHVLVLVRCWSTRVYVVLQPGIVSRRRLVVNGKRNIDTVLDSDFLALMNEFRRVSAIPSRLCSPISSSTRSRSL
jgi:hypothetical protein